MNAKHKSVLEKSFKASLDSVSFRTLVSSSLPFFEGVNTPGSLAMWLMLKYEEYEQYLSYELHLPHYLDASHFKRDYQCAKLFSKSEIFPKVHNTKQEAVKKFIECERKCREINDSIINDGFSSLFSGMSDVSEVIDLTIRKISSILMTEPSLDDMAFKFGPGLNVGLSNNNCSLSDKLTARPSVTEDLATLLRTKSSLNPAWDCISINEVPSVHFSLLNRYEVVPGSRLTFVPKNAKTDRPICIEPLVNSYLQSGIGTCIRNRLKKVGVDLRDQTRNQELARIGSVDGSLATVDLSSASDTISYMVVLNLLPIDWFLLLDITRSPTFTYEGKPYPLEKISSMGNGYTFELESVIFYALAHSVCKYLKLPTTNVNSYGDDIIIPSAGYELLSKALSCLGFSVNLEKSFHEGPFRESCGKDFYLGSQVRPLFLKSKPSAQSLMYWCNHIRREQHLFPEKPYVDLYDSFKKLLPKPFHSLVGPDGFGDGHLIIPFSEYTGNRMHAFRRRGFEGVGFYTLLEKPVRFRNDGRSNYAEALYNAQNIPLPVPHIRGFWWGYSLKHFAQQCSLSTPGETCPRNWAGFNYKRQRTRTYLTKSFAVWKDINPW